MKNIIGDENEWKFCYSLKPVLLNYNCIELRQSRMRTTLRLIGKKSTLTDNNNRQIHRKRR